MSGAASPEITDITHTVDTYLAAWNETDADARDALIARAWVVDGHLVDPPLEGRGHRGIGEMAEAMHAHYPGHRFRRASGVDTHHDAVRFAWELVGPDGAVALAGVDVGLLGDDGRLARITGFFGPLPDA